MPFLMPAGGEHHAQQQEVVRDAEALEGDPRLTGGRGRGERTLGLLVVVGAEVRPPQARAEEQAEHRGGDELGIDRQPGGADPDRHHRLADGDDDHEPVALDEVRRPDLEAALALPVGDPRRRPLEDRGRRPEHRLGRPADRAATSTSPALKRLYGAMPRKAREDCADAVQRNSEAWTATTMKYPTPKARPLPSNASGTASASTRYPAMPPSRIARWRVSRVEMALVSHA
jgi:hypothetical protein